MKITGEHLCAWGLQVAALAGAFVLALVYDGMFIQLFFGIAGALLGVQAFKVIKGESPRAPRKRSKQQPKQ